MKGKTYNIIIKKLYRSDLVICSHSRERKKNLIVKVIQYS